MGVPSLASLRKTGKSKRDSFRRIAPATPESCRHFANCPFRNTAGACARRTVETRAFSEACEGEELSFGLSLGFRWGCGHASFCACFGLFFEMSGGERSRDRRPDAGFGHARIKFQRENGIRLSMALPLRHCAYLCVYRK
jgi:hypothetical protein